MRPRRSSQVGCRLHPSQHRQAQCDVEVPITLFVLVKVSEIPSSKTFLLTPEWSPSSLSLLCGRSCLPVPILHTPRVTSVPRYTPFTTPLLPPLFRLSPSLYYFWTKPDVQGQVTESLTSADTPVVLCQHRVKCLPRRFMSSGSNDCRDVGRPGRDRTTRSVGGGPWERTSPGLGG